jgi:DNA-binding helix-hairpin-helix protein with protein kinase domain
VSEVFDEQGNRLQLGRKLGEGGEGAVFDTMHNGENVAAKIYSHMLSADGQAKLRAMAQIGDTYLKQISAWPISVLLKQRLGPPAGFTMPKFSGYHAVHELFGVGSRRLQFPKADFAFLVGTARNVAAAFDAIHAHGHAIGDVNENNIIVSHQGMVKLLDCDSFHVNTPTGSYPCTVGVAHYTPPELQGRGTFHGVTRTANHDNFGLAILIFQLLFMARHPFSGIPKVRGDLPLEKSIKEYRFAYGADRLMRLNDMPPRALSLDCLPTAMGDMFWRAFTEGGAKTGRPTAKEWVSALDSLRNSLRSCSVEAQHKYPGHLKSCIWCEREKLGNAYFTPASITGPTIDVNAIAGNIAALWSQIQVWGSPTPLPAFNPMPLTLSGRPAPAAAGLSTSKARLAYVALCALAFACSVVDPKLWWLWLTAGGLVIAAVKLQSPTELNNRKSAVDAAQRTFDGTLAEYDRIRTSQRQADALRDLSSIKAQLDGVPQVLAREMSKLRESLVARARHAFLDRHLIRSAKIPGIGEQRKQTLASFGVETAADVTRSAVEAIPGFGQGLARNLTDWRADIEKRFVPPTNLNPTQQDINMVHAQVASMRTKLMQQLRDGATQLQAAKHEMTLRQNNAKGVLEAAHHALEQARADLTVMKASS